MRGSLCTVFVLASTVLLACASAPPAATTTTPSSATGNPPGATEKPEASMAEKTNKASRSAAECPTVGEAIAPPGPPSAGKERHEEIVATFQKHRDKFRCCYDVTRQQSPTIKGNYSIEIILKTDGAIKQISPKKEASDFQDQGMADCVIGVAKELRFSPNADGKETTIPYQFGFTPGGGK